MIDAIAWLICVPAVCVTFAVCFRWFLASQPACTKEEFQRVVNQLNQVTADISTVSATADSVRSAVSMAKVRHG